MRIADLHRRKPCVISFELYPPKNPEGEQKLFDHVVPELFELRPDFFTCTYGAGGGTREKTLDIVSRVGRDCKLPAASHLTCVGASRDEISLYLDEAYERGIENIVALRGDPPHGDKTFKPHPDGFAHATDLVRHIKARGQFSIAVAGYPEGHPEAASRHDDWQRCGEKVEAGADLVITQLFYDNNDFLDFEDYLRTRLGVTVPIVPGILPIISTQQIRRFCGLCGAKLPADVTRRLEEYADDPESCPQYGVELATKMCSELIQHGVPGVHFYVLNRSDSIGQIMGNLKLAPSSPVT